MPTIINDGNLIDRTSNTSNSDMSLLIVNSSRRVDFSQSRERLRRWLRLSADPADNNVETTNAARENSINNSINSIVTTGNVTTSNHIALLGNILGILQDRIRLLGILYDLNTQHLDLFGGQMGMNRLRWIFSWSHRQAFSASLGEEETLAYYLELDKDKIIRLCGEISDYQRISKLTDDQIRERINSHLGDNEQLTIENVKDILASEIRLFKPNDSKFTLEKLIDYASKLLVPSQVRVILEEVEQQNVEQTSQNNVEILQRARVRLQDEVNALRESLETKTKRIKDLEEKLKAETEHSGRENLQAQVEIPLKIVIGGK
jgi:hypothetical protein